MGNWNISIRGIGPHHNKWNAIDADRMAAKFVLDLRAAGHSVNWASITYGGENDLMCPEVYLANREAEDKGKAGPRPMSDDAPPDDILDAMTGTPGESK